MRPLSLLCSRQISTESIRETPTQGTRISHWFWTDLRNSPESHKKPCMQGFSCNVSSLQLDRGQLGTGIVGFCASLNVARISMTASRWIFCKLIYLWKFWVFWKKLKLNFLIISFFFKNLFFEKKVESFVFWFYFLFW